MKPAGAQNLLAAAFVGVLILSIATARSAADTGSGSRGPELQTTPGTDSAPVVVVTNALPSEEKTFEWKAAWKGWDGLHLRLIHKTVLGKSVPGLAKVERVNWETMAGKSSPWLLSSGATNFQYLYLGESRLTADIGGKLALDGAAYVTGSEFKDFDAGIELRRARLYAKGDCFVILPISYQFELGYIPNEFYIEESYLSFKNLPYLGEFKSGQYQTPMGLDVTTSSRDIMFMEPAAPLQALAPGVNAGVQIGRPLFDQRATWALGLFTAGAGHDFGDASTDYGRAITRVTWLPIYEPHLEQPGSARLLHLGLSANVLYSGDSTVRYQSRPESHLAPYVVDTGDIASQGALVVGAEAAWVNGPLCIQGEYLHSFVLQNEGSNLSFPGFYASASWFLTGESRPYIPADGKFGRVIPKQDFRWGKGGWGAWEIAGRYSYVNLDSGEVHGGRMGILMAGVNWYLHPHIKWRFDYGFGRVHDRTPGGNLNIFQTRIELDF